MRSLLALGFLIFLSFKQSEPDELLWQHHKILTWENFKGKPDSISKYTAVLVSRVNMTYYSKKDTLYIKLWAVLIQSESWVKSRSSGLKLLTHERLHFDIAELYARKLRQSILLLKTTKVAAEANLTSLDKFNNENFAKCQALYDKETNHGRVRKKQIEWEKKVALELKSLEQYSNTEIKVLLNKE